MSTETIYCLLPEMMLIIAATLIYIGGVFVPGRQVWSGIAIGAVLVSGWTLYGQYTRMFWPDQHPVADAVAAAEHGSAGEVSPEYPPEPILSVAVPGPLKVDLFSQYVRWLVLVVGLIFVLMATQLAPDVQVPEYLGTLLLAITGLMIVASAQELVLLFIGLELISIPTYILLYLGRRTIESQEATAKYFFLSILSSAVMLYGFSFLYGAAGSTELLKIQDAVGGIDESSGFLWFARLSLVLIFAGLGFKVTAVPFHFYAPDVYQGTTAGNAALLSVLPKLGGLVALVRIVSFAMPGMETYAWHLALVLALVTMTLGNVVALWQDNIRRLLAYSSIAHGGYMLIGLAVAFAGASGADSASGFDGVAGMLFYIAAYALATTGTFAAVIYLGRDDRPIESVDDLAGIGRNHPWTALSLAVFMFSLTGIPPLAGFWGKLNLFAGALSIHLPGEEGDLGRYWFILLAVVGVLNAAISAGYYLRIVGVMYFRSSQRDLQADGGTGAGLAMVLCAVLVVFVGLQPNPLQVGANAAAQSARLPGGGATLDIASEQPSDVSAVAMSVAGE